MKSPVQRVIPALARYSTRGAVYRVQRDAMTSRRRPCCGNFKPQGFHPQTLITVYGPEEHDRSYLAMENHNSFPRKRPRGCETQKKINFQAWNYQIISFN